MTAMSAAIDDLHSEPVSIAGNVVRPVRIELKTADLEFSAEGEADWVAAQLDKVLANLSLQQVDAQREDDSVMGTILG